MGLFHLSGNKNERYSFGKLELYGEMIFGNVK